MVSEIRKIKNLSDDTKVKILGYERSAADLLLFSDNFDD